MAGTAATNLSFVLYLVKMVDMSMDSEGGTVNTTKT